MDSKTIKIQFFFLHINQIHFNKESSSSSSDTLSQNYFSTPLALALTSDLWPTTFFIAPASRHRSPLTLNPPSLLQAQMPNIVTGKNKTSLLPSTLSRKENGAFQHQISMTSWKKPIAFLECFFFIFHHFSPFLSVAIWLNLSVKNWKKERVMKEYMSVTHH